jgi:hypothetical protein
VGPQVGYNTTESSLMTAIDNNYWNYGGRIDGRVLLPGKIEVMSDCYFNYRQQLAAFRANPNQINWNASLSKQVLKDKSGKVYLVVNDILNQNIGLNRNITSNFISEERYSRISRYFLLKFEWTFNKMPGKN